MNISYSSPVVEKYIYTGLFLAAVSFMPLHAAGDTAGESLSQRDAVAGARWKEKLGLNTEQTRRFVAAEKEKEADMKVLRDDHNAVLFKLRSQLTDGAPENIVQESLLQIAKIRKALQDRNDRFDAASASFLAPTQRAKLLVWKSLLPSRGKSGRGLEPGDLREFTVGDELEPD